MTPSPALARLFLPLALSLLTGVFAAPPPAGSARSETAFLPDSAELARVNDRVIRVHDYRYEYFDSDIPTRPAADSAGRVEFLTNMVDKEVLGLTAAALGKPLSFEDRLELREVTESALARLLLRRKVDDRVVVTEEEKRALYPQFNVELRLRYILFGDLATAQRVRLDLMRGRITWKQAARTYSLGPDSLIDGDLGWVGRLRFRGPAACEVFELRPPGFSAVLRDDDGYKIWQCLERRSVAGPPYSSARAQIQEDLRQARAAPLREEFFAVVRARAEAQYDTANMVWLAERFHAAQPRLSQLPDRMTIDLVARAPRIAPADTGRVLARTKNGPFTVRHMLWQYDMVPSVLRRKITGFVTLFDVVEKMLLQPEVVALAREQGLEQDPEIVAQVNARRQALLVERMYQDSVMARVRVTDAQRRKYYQDHRPEFVTRERVHYVTIVRATEAGADSLLMRLKAGESAPEIVRADSLAGSPFGRVRWLMGDQPNTYRSVLMEELRPGQSTKARAEGGGWFVFTVLEHEYPRPMEYDEVVNIVDESVQNIEAERLLAAWLSRLRKRYRIESHPELVMRIRLTDPFADALDAPTD